VNKESAEALGTGDLNRASKNARNRPSPPQKSPGALHTLLPRKETEKMYNNDRRLGYGNSAAMRQQIPEKKGLSRCTTMIMRKRRGENRTVGGTAVDAEKGGVARRGASDTKVLVGEGAARSRTVNVSDQGN